MAIRPEICFRLSPDSRTSLNAWISTRPWRALTWQPNPHESAVWLLASACNLLDIKPFAQHLSATIRFSSEFGPRRSRQRAKIIHHMARTLRNYEGAAVCHQLVRVQGQLAVLQCRRVSDLKEIIQLQVRGGMVSEINCTLPKTLDGVELLGIFPPET